MKPGVILTSLFLLLAVSGIAAIFWNQELQYVLPTPVPPDYVPVAPGEAVAATDFLKGDVRKPVLLHFFNPECPCSRFNLKHLKVLVKRYGNEVSFVTVVPESLADRTDQIRSDLGLAIPVIADKNEVLARRCGVYSTPQAALIGTDGKLYYRGNYNKSRYCTLRNSNFAQMAIDSLLAGAPAPEFDELAVKSYGCELAEPDLISSF